MRSRKFRVIAKNMETPSTLVLTIEDRSEEAPMSYQPGQYATIRFKYEGRPTAVRCFSLMSIPTRQDILQFGVKVKGDFTQSLANSVKIGDEVTVRGPFGDFIFNATRDQSAVFLAGGIGITPFISMIRYATRLQLPNPIVLIYSCHEQDDIPFLHELVKLEEMNPNFHVLFCISHGPVDRLAGARVFQGPVTPELLKQTIPTYLARSSFFICGPTGFMRGMTNALTMHGVPASKIRTETYGQPARRLRSVWRTLSFQVYALTGVGLFLGPPAVMARDVNAPPPELKVDTGQSVSSTSSRQSSLNQQINSLTNPSQSPTSSGTTSPSTTTSTPPPTSTSTSSPSQSSPSGGSSGSGTTSTPPPSTSGSGSSGSGSTSSPPPSTPKAVAPVVSLSASSTQITSGQSVTLMWSVNSNATSPVTCSASGGWSGSKSASGSQTVTPYSSGNYTLTCSNSAGSNSQSVYITVTPASTSQGS